MSSSPSYGFRLTIAALATAVILGGTATIAVVVALAVGWWFPVVAALVWLLVWIGPRWWVVLEPENVLMWIWVVPRLWRWAAAARVPTH